MTIASGYHQAINDYKSNNIVLGQFASIDAIKEVLLGTTHKILAKHNREETLKQWHAYHWFRNDEHDKDTKCKRGIKGQKITATVYAIEQHQLTIPTIIMNILSIKPVGLKPVYSLHVAGTHNFIGNGIVIHDHFKH